MSHSGGSRPAPVAARLKIPYIYGVIRESDSTAMGSNWEKDILAAIAPHIERAASEAYARGVADGVAKERNRVLGLIGGSPSAVAAQEPDDDGEDDEPSVGVSDERSGGDQAPEYGAISALVRKALVIAGGEGAETADIIRIIRHSTGTSLEPDQVRQNLKIQAKNGYAIRVQRGRYTASDKLVPPSGVSSVATGPEVGGEPKDIESALAEEALDKLFE